MKVLAAASVCFFCLAASAQVAAPRQPVPKGAIAKAQLQQMPVTKPLVAPTPDPKSWDKEPESFLGIRLGERLTVPACPIRNIGQLTRIDTLDFEAIRKLEGVCFDPRDTSVKYPGPAGPSFYKLINVPSLGIPYSVSVRMKADVVEKVTIDLKQTNFSVLVDVFNQRYGAPTSVDTSMVKSNSGVEFSVRDVLWQGKKISIRMYERLNRIDESYVVVSDNALMEREVETIKAKRASEAQKF